jgi:acyl carrier protein
VDTPLRPADAGSLADWLCEAIAVRLDREPDEVDVDAPFGEFGLDSVSVMDILSDLEDRVGRRLDSSVLYDYPSVTSLAEFVAKGDPGA